MLTPPFRWHPELLPNCVLSLDSSVGVSASGASVLAWADQSGKGWHGTAANGPQLTPGQFGERPGITFSAANQEIVNAAFTELPTDHTYHKFFVCKAAAGGVYASGGGLFENPLSTAYPQSVSSVVWSRTVGAVTNVFSDAHTYTATIIGGPPNPVIAGVPVILELWCTGGHQVGSLRVAINGKEVLMSVNTRTAEMTATGYVVGNRRGAGAGQYFSGTIGAALVYGAILSDADRWHVLRYLSNRFEIGLDAFGYNFEPDIGNPLWTAEQPWEGPSLEDPRLVRGAGYWDLWYCSLAPAQSWQRSIGYRRCVDAKFPYGFVSNAAPVIRYDAVPGGTNALLASPEPVHLPNGGGWHMYVHGYNIAEGKGRPYLFTCSEEEYPGPWHYNSSFSLPMGGAGAFDEYFLHPECVFGPDITPDGKFHMVYSGGTAGYAVLKIGHAYSDDGIFWTKDPGNPRVSPGDLGAWTAYAIYALGSGFKANGKFYIAIQAQKVNHDEPWKSGMMSTVDFETYIEHPESPVLCPTVPTSWAQGSIEGGSMYFDPVARKIYRTYCNNNAFGPSTYQGGLYTAANQIAP